MAENVLNKIIQKKNEKIFEDSKKAINEIPGVTKINIVTTYHKKNNEDSDDDTSISSELEQPQPESVGTSKIKYIIFGHKFSIIKSKLEKISK